MRIAFLVPSETGHLHTAIPLALALRQNGHICEFIGLIDGAKKVENYGLKFIPIGEDKFPPGRLNERMYALAKQPGLQSIKLLVSIATDHAEISFNELPQILRGNYDAVIVDQVIREGGTICEHAGIPFISLASALALNRNSDTPPFFTPWKPKQGLLYKFRNFCGYKLLSYLTSPLQQKIDKQRGTWGLPRHKHPNDAYSDIAQISQLPSLFDFQPQVRPPHFHYVGPFHGSQKRTPVDFCWNKLDERPLIYVSLGTILAKTENLLELIAESCEDLEVQVVMTLGGCEDLTRCANFPENVMVVEYAPQLELLERASLCVTHAGLNTTLECLAKGVPMLAIPLMGDQLGSAARIKHAQVGEWLCLKKISSERCRAAISNILEGDIYKENARRFKEMLKSEPGVGRAVTIIEEAISNNVHTTAV